MAAGQRQLGDAGLHAALRVDAVVDPRAFDAVYRLG